MGITGLISFCKDAITPTTIFNMRNKGVTVAVDSYCFLHKGAYSCPDKLSRGIQTTQHIDYCMKFVNLLLQMNIKPIMVFDGRNLAAKEQTEKKRRKDRDAAKEKAKELMKAGKVEDARKEYSKSVDITHEHAVALMRECHKIGVDCIVAMFEADSQLAYLNKIGIADYVISEDSDLILFGVTKILFKFQLDGRCSLFESSKLPQTLGVSEEKFEFEKFRRICILSGCDYLDNLPGIGLAKARKFMMLTEETDMRRALIRIPSYLNMKQLIVSDEYIEGFLRAEATFKFMFVFDPIKREMLRLNEPDDEELKLCTNAGEILDQNVALQIALGNLNPRTLKSSNDFNPDTHIKFSTNMKSIWRMNSGIKGRFQGMKSISKQTRLSSFFESKNHAEVQKITKIENEVSNHVEVRELLSSYCMGAFTQSQTNSSKRKNENGIEESSSDFKPFNPFSKRPRENFSENDSKVVSKYFPVKPTPASLKQEIEIRSPDRAKMESAVKALEEKKDSCSQYYQKLQKFMHNHTRKSKELKLDVENSENDSKRSNEDSKSSTEEEGKQIVEEDVIDVDSLVMTSTTTKIPHRPTIGMTKKTSSQNLKINNDKSQTLLSRFGFEKRTSAK